MIEGLGVQLSDTKPRYSFGLCGTSGRGKTLGAASFLAPDEKLIVYNVEGGPEDGPGGLATLLHAEDIFPRIKPSNVWVIPVQSWGDMQSAYTKVKQNRDALVADGYTTQLLDGGTALSYQIRQALVNLAPEPTNNPKRHNILGSIVTTLEGYETSAMELYYYDLVYDRYIDMHAKLRQLPFTFITTFLEKEVYDEETRRTKIGVGPKLIGKQLPAQVPAEVDGFFHCEIKDGKHVWLTSNDPTQFDSMNPAVAKHRFGLKLAKYEPADGFAILTKLGVGER